MLAESAIYKSSRLGASSGEHDSRPTAAVRVALTNIEARVAEVPSVLPVVGPVMVGENRLKDRDLHLDGVHYLTNDLSSFDITAGVRAAFKAEMAKAREMQKQ